VQIRASVAAGVRAPVRVRGAVVVSMPPALPTNISLKNELSWRTGPP
jgi:hypothetical protein